MAGFQLSIWLLLRQLLMMRLGDCSYVFRAMCANTLLACFIFGMHENLLGQREGILPSMRAERFQASLQDDMPNLPILRTSSASPVRLARLASLYNHAWATATQPADLTET